MSDRDWAEKEEFAQELVADADAVAETKYLLDVPGYRDSIIEALREGEESAVLFSDLDW